MSAPQSQTESAETASKQDTFRQGVLSKWPEGGEGYHPTAAELDFLRRATGLTDEAGLRRHVEALREKALNVFPFTCIFLYMFATTSISRPGGYGKALLLGKQREGAILLDVGCCFGGDVRMAALDGFPPEQIVGTDLHAEFWDLGFELFRDSKETMPATFLPGDFFDPSFLSPTAPGTLESTTPLSHVKTLTELHGRVSAMHAANFFHRARSKRRPSHVWPS
ncbi:hypothetical protein CALCODRAFT_498236 [Calocera cornea HHB12733]|uniref:Methyltransferase domain-containing protein n=1 Tax=Calocera cornea HHB12733 TaxID=1353952 RepID=A0A165EY31_9BASI|nr:hypothetical protein CALCODRAFT_498236 [Calocera cornea HHB12733]